MHRSRPEGGAAKGIHQHPEGAGVAQVPSSASDWWFGLPMLLFVWAVTLYTVASVGYVLWTEGGVGDSSTTAFALSIAASSSSSSATLHATAVGMHAVVAPRPSMTMTTIVSGMNDTTIASPPEPLIPERWLVVLLPIMYIPTVVVFGYVRWMAWQFFKHN